MFNFLLHGLLSKFSAVSNLSFYQFLRCVFVKLNRFWMTGKHLLEISDTKQRCWDLLSTCDWKMMKRETSFVASTWNFNIICQQRAKYFVTRLIVNNWSSRQRCFFHWLFFHHGTFNLIFLSCRTLQNFIEVIICYFLYSTNLCF